MPQYIVIVERQESIGVEADTPEDAIHVAMEADKSEWDDDGIIQRGGTVTDDEGEPLLSF